MTTTRVSDCPVDVEMVEKDEQQQVTHEPPSASSPSSEEDGDTSHSGEEIIHRNLEEIKAVLTPSENDITISPTSKPLSIAEARALRQKPSSSTTSEPSPTPSARKKSKLEALEIDMDPDADEENRRNGLLEISRTDTEDGDEEAALIKGSASTEESREEVRQQRKSAVPRVQRVGNVRVLHLPCGRRQVVVGPHWFGPPVVVAILFGASSHFILLAASEVGLGTTLICGVWTAATLYYLIKTAYSDPGIVPLQQTEKLTRQEAMARLQQQQQEQDESSASPSEKKKKATVKFCWCEVCQALQAPDSQHCPDCNVCVAGFDHHCVWMGSCVGRGNLKSFVRFNLCWLLYLAYAILWVSLVGPHV